MKTTEEKKPNIILLESWREHFKLMTKEQVYDVIMAMYDYQYDGIEPESIPVEILHFWLMARKWIDDNNQRFGDICRKRKEAINSRWKKQKEKEALAAMKPEERLAHELIKKVKFDGGSIADHISSSNLQFLSECLQDNFTIHGGGFDEKAAKKCISHIAKQSENNGTAFNDCYYDSGDGDMPNYEKLVNVIGDMIEDFSSDYYE